MNRETIYAALFDIVSNAYGWKTTSRILKHWQDLAPIEQPACFMAQVGEEAIRTTRLPAKWVLDVRLYLYTHAKTTVGEVPAVSINKAIDAIAASLKPVPAVNTQTLGGLVEDARIEGQITTDEGYLGEQAVAIIPIKIITAD